MQGIEPALVKSALRKKLRAARREYVDALDPRIRALTFLRPPSPLVAVVPPGAVIGLYFAGLAEAPAGAYARFFHDAGHDVALPWFAARDASMEFRMWRSAHLNELLEPGPFGIMQPMADAAPATPTFLLLPLVGFTAAGARLGQGGGHYDRWLAAHPGVPAIGMAWDCQMVESLPDEAHDHPLTAVVTPTRIYGPF